MVLIHSFHRSCGHHNVHYLDVAQQNCEHRLSCPRSKVSWHSRLERRKEDQKRRISLEIHYSNFLACQFRPFDFERSLNFGHWLWPWERNGRMENSHSLHALFVWWNPILLCFQPIVFQCGGFNSYIWAHWVLCKLDCFEVVKCFCFRLLTSASSGKGLERPILCKDSLWVSSLSLYWCSTFRSESQNQTWTT